MAQQFAFDSPDAAIAAISERLTTATVESSVTELRNRVLAQQVVADRDSPAGDVSAMDGYAIRLDDLKNAGDVLVRGESVPGSPPPEMFAGSIVRIFTGAIVPAGCQAVVKREDTIESDGSIQFREEAFQTTVRSNIRYAGENRRAGESVLDRGALLQGPQLAALCNFGVTEVDVFAKVRVAILTTGDELADKRSGPLLPWQIRNSNRVALQGLFRDHGWLDEPAVMHVSDERIALRDQLVQALASHDAVILTGGVSMGDYDFVPDVVREIGAEIVFHKLPLRPGKPILGAVTREGKLILGLPGNPVSATMTCRRFAIPLLRKISGQTVGRSPRPVVRLESPGSKTLPLYWMRGVVLTADGMAKPVVGKGSGDLVTLAQTDGFVELPPGATGEGPWPYWGWR